MLTPIQREHLDLIRSKTHGILQPREVLADARNPNSPLHDLFLWNDTEAARAYRLIQARQIVKVAVRMMVRAPVEPVRAVISERPASPMPRQPRRQTVTQPGVEAEFRQAINDVCETYDDRQSLLSVIADIRVVLAKRFAEPKPYFPGGDRPQGGTMRRFEMKPYTHGEAHATKETSALRSDHPALTGMRTQFPTRVFNSADADHILVSGHSNAKIGAFVTKGPWAGMSIYTLTLEERATCPSECHLLAECYGNAMPMAKRWKYDQTFMDRLDAELLDKAREHPAGFIVRLHVLGDFPDLDYVGRWAEWLREHRELHAFGYTAHPRYGLIGQAIADLNRNYPDRCAIRFSVAPEIEPQPMQATAIWRKEWGRIEEGIVCPASSGDTECCGTCGLCWSPAFADKRVVFIGHGMRAGRAAKGIDTTDTPEIGREIAPPLPPQKVGVVTSSPISRIEALARVSKIIVVAPIIAQPELERTRDGATSVAAVQLRDDAQNGESAPASREDIVAWAKANRVGLAQGKVSLSAVNEARKGWGLPPFRLVAASGGTAP